MADAIQKGIEAAQQDMVKDAEEKLLEEVNGVWCHINIRITLNDVSCLSLFLERRLPVMGKGHHDV